MFGKSKVKYVIALNLLSFFGQTKIICCALKVTKVKVGVKSLYYIGI